MNETIKQLSDAQLLAKPKGDFSPASAADELEVCVASIWNWIKSGELESYKVGRARRIFRKSVADFKRRGVQ